MRASISETLDATTTLSKGPHGIKITDPGKKTVIRLYVPGGEEELVKWLAAIERCCQGVRGSPSPPPFAATPVAVF